MTEKGPSCIALSAAATAAFTTSCLRGSPGAADLMSASIFASSRKTRGGGAILPGIFDGKGDCAPAMSANDDTDTQRALLTVFIQYVLSHCFKVNFAGESPPCDGSGARLFAGERRAPSG